MTDYITKDLLQQSGSNESARLYFIVDVKTGESEVVLEKTISKRMPVQELEKAERMFELLTRGGGRRVYELEDLIQEKI